MSLRHPRWRCTQALRLTATWLWAQVVDLRAVPVHDPLQVAPVAQVAVVQSRRVAVLALQSHADLDRVIDRWC